MAGTPWEFTVLPSTISEVVVSNGTTTVTLTKSNNIFTTSSFVETTSVNVSATGYTSKTVEAGVSSVDLTNYVSNFTKDSVNYVLKDSNAAGWAMPSNIYDDLTLGASGATYTMPANGWIIFRKGITTSRAAFYNIFNLTISNTLIASNTWSSSENAWIKGVCFPVKKNDVIQIDYDVDGTTELFRFIYAEGSKSEAN